MTWGQRARAVLADCAQISEAARLPPLSPVVVFFSALAMIDRHAAVMPKPYREKALNASADFVRSHTLDDAAAMKRVIYDFEGQAAAGELDYVTPLDLLKGAVSTSSRAIEFGLSNVDMDLETLLSRIETDIPADDLKDEEADYSPPLFNAKYALIIEGPEFRHDGNRYETLEQAQSAKRFLESWINGDEFFVEPNAKGFGVSPPPEWKSATLIYIEEL